MNILEKILSLGTDNPKRNPFQESQTRFTNGIALFVIVIIGFYAYLHYIHEQYILIISNIVYILTSGLILFFNKSHKHTASFWVLGIGYTLSLASTAVLLGPQNQIEFYLLLVGVGGSLYFDKNNEKRFLFIFSLFVLIGLKIFFLYYPNGLTIKPSSPVFAFVNAIVLCSLLYYILDNAFESKRDYQELLEKHNASILEQNQKLEEKVKERTTEIENQTEALQRYNEELERLTYVASHDLREPLRNIMSYVQLLQRNISRRKYDDIDEYTNYITWAVRRMDNITNDIVIYSEINATERNQEKININVLLTFLQKDLSDLIEKKGAILDIKDNLPSINSNPRLLNILFKNLIENGINYNNKPNPTIKISHEVLPDAYLFKIEDNGVGIEKDYEKVIFTMFKRLDNSLEEEGSGIGLAICHKIVENYGGQIWLESKLDIGTTFYFTLPK